MIYEIKQLKSSQSMKGLRAFLRPFLPGEPVADGDEGKPDGGEEDGVAEAGEKCHCDDDQKEIRDT